MQQEVIGATNLWPFANFADPSVTTTASAANRFLPVNLIVTTASLDKGDLPPREVKTSRTTKSCTNRATVSLVDTYHRCNPQFAYESRFNPRRILTKPSEGVYNNGYDNKDNDYILVVNDIIEGEDGRQYVILDLLGHGTFGQVAKCQEVQTGHLYAIKVIKNKPAYYNQSMTEVRMLDLLNRRYDPDDVHHIMRLFDSFIFRSHLCLVFEVLSINLYELIKQNNFRGLSPNLVKVLTAQILDCLVILQQAKIIHCDLKPENILLKSLTSASIKVIDFGSACQEQRTLYTYIQSRFYRAPEVLLGAPYSSAIDMWSLGCICAELFLGLPIFPGSSEYNQLSRIVEMLGHPPWSMIELGKNSRRYYERRTRSASTPSPFPPDRVVPMTNASGAPVESGGMVSEYIFKDLETYRAETGLDERPSKRYFTARDLPTLIRTYPMRTPTGNSNRNNVAEITNEQIVREALIDFLQGVLKLNPAERWTPAQARLHPFITGAPYTGPFTPPLDNPLESRPRAPSSPFISTPAAAIAESSSTGNPSHKSSTSTSAVADKMAHWGPFDHHTSSSSSHQHISTAPSTSSSAHRNHQQPQASSSSSSSSHSSLFALATSFLPGSKKSS